MMNIWSFCLSSNLILIAVTAKSCKKSDDCGMGAYCSFINKECNCTFMEKVFHEGRDCSVAIKHCEEAGGEKNCNSKIPSGCESVFGAYFCKCPSGRHGNICQFTLSRDQTNLQRMSTPYIAYKPKVKALEKWNIFICLKTIGSGFTLALQLKLPNVRLRLVESQFIIYENPKKYCLDSGIPNEICNFVPSESLNCVDHVLYFPFNSSEAKLTDVPFRGLTLLFFNFGNADKKVQEKPVEMFSRDSGIFSISEPRSDYLCTPDVILSNCALSDENMVIYRRSKAFYIKLDFLDDPSCTHPLNSSIHEWKLYSVPFSFSSVFGASPVISKVGDYNFVFEKYQLPTGLYRIEVVVTVRYFMHGVLFTKWNFGYCFFRIKHSPIRAVIKGGSKNKVSVKSQVVLDASDSCDPNEDLCSRRNLVYKWSWCFADSQGPCSESTVKNPVFKPDIQIKVDQIYNFTLIVRNKKYKTPSDEVFQLVTIVRETLTELFIFCLRNCGLNDIRTNPNEIIYLEARTAGGKGKSGTNSGFWSWSCEDLTKNETINVDDIKEEGHFRNQLLIPPRKLKPGRKYKFGVKLGGEEPGETEITITVAALPGRAEDAGIVITNTDQQKRRFDIFAAGFYARSRSAFLNYCFYEKGKDNTVPDTLFGCNTKGKLNDVYLKTGDVYVKICDDINGICITESKTVEVSQDKPDADLIKHLSDEIMAKIDSGRPENAILNIIALTDMLDSSENNSKTFSMLLDIVSELPLLDDFKVTKHYSSVISKLLVKGDDISSSKSSNETLLSLDKLTGAGNFIYKVTHFLVNLTESFGGLDSEITNDELREVSLDLMFGIEVLNSARDKIVENTEYQEYSEKLVESKKLSLTTVNSIKAISNALSQRLLPGQEAVTVKTKSSNVWVKVDSIKRMCDMLIPPHPPSSIQKTSIKLPKSFGRIKRSEKSDIMVLNVNVLNSDPLNWNPLDTKPNSDIVLVDLNSRLDDFKTESVNGYLPEPFDLFIDIRNVTTRVINGSVTRPSDSASDADKDKLVAVHRLRSGEQIKEGSGVGGIFRLKFNLSVGNDLKMKLSKNLRPDFDMLINESTLVSKDSDYFEVLTIGDNPDTKYYVGLLPTDSASQIVNYFLEISTFQCQVWYDNKWRSDLCTVGKNSTSESIHCQCSHLSAFGGLTFITPNKIDPINDAPLFMTVLENPYIVALVLTILIFYFVVLFFACYWDKMDVINAKTIYLEDNMPSDKYPYVIVVFTGSKMSSGTTSNVCFQLLGDKAASRAHVFQCSWRKVLTRGSDDWFLMFNHSQLGNIVQLFVWQDFSGSSPSWYCIDITVIDVIQEKEYFFIVDRWFTILLQNSHLTYSLKPEVGDEIKDSGVIAETNISIGLREGHIWFGIFTGHPRSSISRSERLSVAVFALLTTMLVSIMFYGVMDSVQMDVSVFMFDITDWIIAIQAMVIQMPLAILTAFFFKKSRTNIIKGDNDVDGGDVHKKIVLTGGSRKNKKRFQKSKTTGDVNAVKPKDFIGKLKRNFIYKYIQKYTIDFMSVDPLLPAAVTLSKYKRKTRKVWFILAWIFCLSVMLIESYLIMLYGLKFGVKKSLIWLCSVFTSSFQDVFFMEPVFLILFAILKAYIFKKTHEVFNFKIVSQKEMKQYSIENSEENEIKSQEKRNQLQKYYTPVSKMKELEIRNQYYPLWARKWMIFDLTVLITYVLTFLVFTLSLQLYSSYLTKHQIDDLLFSQKGDTTIGFDSVTDKRSLLFYLEHNLIPTLHVTKWYNDYPLEPTDKELTGFTADYYHKIVGFPRLRQQRANRNRTCLIPTSMESFLQDCYLTSLKNNEDLANYNGSWNVLSSVNDAKRVSSPWIYLDSSETQSIGFWGKSGNFYHGGGYVANLSRSRLRSIVMLSELDDNNWLDDYTRVVFIELVLYNVNNDVFSLVTLIVEHLANGVYTTQTQILSLKLGEKLNAGTLFGMVIVSIIVIIMGSRIFYLIGLYGLRGYFRKLRLVLNFAVFIVGFVLIISWFTQFILNFLYGKYLEDAASHDYISFYNPIYSKRLMDCQLAVLTVLIVFQIVFEIDFFSRIIILRDCIEFSFIVIAFSSIIYICFIIVMNYIFVLLQCPSIGSYILLINTHNYGQLYKNLMFPEKIVLPVLFTISSGFLILIIRVVLVYNYTVATYHNTFHLLYKREEKFKIMVASANRKSKKDISWRLRGGMDREYFNNCESSLNNTCFSATDLNDDKKFCNSTINSVIACGSISVKKINNNRLNTMRLISIDFLNDNFNLK